MLKKRILAGLLSLAMLLNLVAPLQVRAAEEVTDPIVASGYVRVTNSTLKDGDYVILGSNGSAVIPSIVENDNGLAYTSTIYTADNISDVGSEAVWNITKKSEGVYTVKSYEGKALSIIANDAETGEKLVNLADGEEEPKVRITLANSISNGIASDLYAIYAPANNWYLNRWGGGNSTKMGVYGTLDSNSCFYLYTKGYSVSEEEINKLTANVGHKDSYTPVSWEEYLLAREDALRGYETEEEARAAYDALAAAVDALKSNDRQVSVPDIAWNRTAVEENNYIKNLAYVNSGGEYASGNVTYPRYSALTWEWRDLQRLVEDDDVRVTDVWSTQSNGMSACVFDSTDSGAWDRADVYKIAGTFAWPEGYDLNETTITLQSKNDSNYTDIYGKIKDLRIQEQFKNGKVIPVNDDVYVVMWVEGAGEDSGKPTIDNINDYLLFWTGTSSKGFWTQNGNTNADWNRTTPATLISAKRQGVRAFRNSWPNMVGVTDGLTNADVEVASNEVKNVLNHTDGWYTLTDTTSINSVMRANYGETGIAEGAKVHLDLYCFNNSGSGIMDELEIVLSKQLETETDVIVKYYLGNLDAEGYLGEDILTNQTYGSEITIPSGTKAGQLDSWRAIAIQKAGNMDVSHGVQMAPVPYEVERGKDNIIKVLYTPAGMKTVILTADTDTRDYTGDPITLDNVTVTLTGAGDAESLESGCYKLPDGNIIENVHSVVTQTNPGIYDNNFFNSEGQQGEIRVIDSQTDSDITASYTVIKNPGKLKITYEPAPVTRTYDFGVTNKYTDNLFDNLLNAVEKTAGSVTENSDEVTVADDKTFVTYKPAAADTGDSVNLSLNFAGGYTVAKKVDFIPATNVMYEENLVKPELVTEPETNAWSITGTAGTPEITDNNGTVYGYTNGGTYANGMEFSNGAAYKATLNLNGAVTAKTANATEFNFTGTGFDLISECGTDTGMLLVRVSNATDDGYAKIYLVDTYFRGDDGNVNEGKDPIITGPGILDYQVPVVRALDMPYGNHEVKIYGYLANTAGAVKPAAVAYSMDAADCAETAPAVSQRDIVNAALEDFGLDDEFRAEDVEVSFMSEDSVLNGGTGNTGAAGAPMAAFAMLAEEETTEDAPAAGTGVNVYIDGFRVYKPLENDAAIYTTDGEAGVKYASVYDFVENSAHNLTGKVDEAFVYVETRGEVEISEPEIKGYKNQGPENEVYLAPGCGIAFALENYKTGNIVQLAMKCVGGSVTAHVNNSLVKSTATEMYYPVAVQYDEKLKKNYVMIVNPTGSKGVLSLSGLKISSNITASAEPALARVLLARMKAEFAPGYSVTVDGGTINNSTARSGKYEYNTKLTVTADKAPEEKVFAGWKVKTDADEEGKILSTDSKYTFFVGSNLALEAVYEDKPIKIDPQAYLQDITASKRTDNKYDMRFLAQLVVPDGYQIKQAGLLWSAKGETYLQKLDFNSKDTGVKRSFISKISSTHQFSVTIKGVPQGTKVPGKVFAVLENEDGERIIQSAALLGTAQ